MLKKMYIIIYLNIICKPEFKYLGAFKYFIYLVFDSLIDGYIKNIV